jgi:hypothetical protein
LRFAAPACRRFLQHNMLTPKQSPFREQYEGLRADGRHGP